MDRKWRESEKVIVGANDDDDADGGTTAQSGYKFAQLYVAQMSILFRDISRYGQN